MSDSGHKMDANRRKLLIVVGVGFVAATICTFLFYRMISGQLEGGMGAAQVERTITIAARELPRGTRLRPEHLKTQPYQGEIPSGAFADPVAIAGRVLTADVDQGEVVYANALADKNDDWMASEIPEGMRAVTVHVGEFAGVTQHLQVGDRVDVLVADGNRSPGRLSLQVKTLLQNIEVLATGQEIQRDGRPNPIPAVTLLVDARDSQDVNLADQSGAIRLALRNPLDSGTQETRGNRLSDLLNQKDDESRNARRQARHDAAQESGAETGAASGSTKTPEVAALGRE